MTKHFKVQWQEGDPVVVEVARYRPYSGATPLQAISFESLRITEQVEKQQEKLRACLNCWKTWGKFPMNCGRESFRNQIFRFFEVSVAKIAIIFAEHF